MSKCGIYAIINIITDKLYVGSSVYIRDRWNLHRNQLNDNKHHCKYLQRAWNKYGQINFIFTVIEFCVRENLIEKEQYWIDSLKPEYNSFLIAGSALGYKHTEETKAKMKLKQISQKHRDSVSAANKNRVGQKYNVKTEHTVKCKCNVCSIVRNEKKRAWRAKKKLENPEFYMEQQRKWDKNKVRYNKKFVIIDNPFLLGL